MIRLFEIDSRVSRVNFSMPASDRIQLYESVSSDSVLATRSSPPTCSMRFRPSCSDSRQGMSIRSMSFDETEDGQVATALQPGK